MKGYVLVYVSAVAAALLATPLVARLARRMGITDRPDPRKVHSSKIPRIGGLAVFAAVVAVIIPAILLDGNLSKAFGAIRPQLLALLGTGGFIFLIGFLDDSVHVSARVKLVSQIAAAVAACALGIRIEKIGLPGSSPINFGWWSWPISILWIVGITNAVNLIDGLDGLAAGICAITCGVIAVFAVSTNQVVMAALMLAVLGSLTGFLFYNFNPAKIFLGDCGSMSLGFLLGTSSIMCGMKPAALVGLALPALALGLPIFDTFFSMLRRTLERRSVFSPDRGHVHHRLMDMVGQRRAVITMYIVTALAAGLGMFMLFTRNIGTLVVFVCSLIPVLIMFHVVGVVRLREAFSAFQRNRAIARDVRDQQRNFEEMQLRLMEAGNLDQWWRVLRRAARRMGLARLAIEVNGQGGGQTTLTWRHPRFRESPDKTIHVSIPPRDNLRWALQVEIDFPPDSPLEWVGRRVSLFGQLVGQRDVEELPAEAADAAGGEDAER